MQDHGFLDQNDILQVLTTKFQRRFPKDLGIMIQNAISLSKDIGMRTMKD